MFEVTVAYDWEFRQVFYGVRCGFDAWSFTFGLHWSLLHSAHTSNKRCLRKQVEDVVPAEHRDNRRRWF